MDRTRQRRVKVKVSKTEQEWMLRRGVTRSRHPKNVGPPGTEALLPSREYNLGFLGLLKLLFKRKKCKACGGKLVRRTESKRADSDWSLESTDSGLRADWHGERHLCRYVYDCPHCETTTPLEDL